MASQLALPVWLGELIIEDDIADFRMEDEEEDDEEEDDEGPFSAPFGAKRAAASTEVSETPRLPILLSLPPSQRWGVDFRLRGIKIIIERIRRRRAVSIDTSIL